MFFISFLSVTGNLTSPSGKISLEKLYPLGKLSECKISLVNINFRSFPCNMPLTICRPLWLKFPFRL